MQSTLRLPAELDSLEPLRVFVVNCARAQGVNENRFPHIELVIEELVTNLVAHAYKEVRGEVEVECLSRENFFCVRISDSGSPFNPLDRPPPDLSTNLEDRPIGGLGIHLVRKIADRVDYRREQNQNFVEVGFRLVS